MKCPGFETIIDYADNRLAADEAEALAAHLTLGCQACEASFQWYESVKTMLARDDSVEPPSWVFKRAIRIFDNQRARPRLVERMGHKIASLVFDSLARPAVVGVRSTGTTNRQLLYQAGDYSVDLQVAPLDQLHADLIGQVLKEDEPSFGSVAGLSLELIRRGEVVRVTSTNEMGEFAISGIDLGVYDLKVKIADESITISGLPITQSHSN